MLPTFFVIGAAKAATTSLHAYLASHPEIHMSRIKEPRYFAQGLSHRREPAANRPVTDRLEYEALFDSPLLIRGESSPAYSMFPRIVGVPARIRAAVPAARFVYLVRDPVDRAISHYLQPFYAGRERRDAPAAFADFERSDHEYVCPSRYATQIEQYLRHFDEDRLLVVDQAEFGAKPEETLKRVFTFLGADPAGTLPAPGVRLNVRADKRRNSSTLFWLRSSRPLQRAAAALPPALRQRAASAVTSRLSPTDDPPDVPADLRECLREHFAPEAKRLRELTGQSFDSWSV